MEFVWFGCVGIKKKFAYGNMVIVVLKTATVVLFSLFNSKRVFVLFNYHSVTILLKFQLNHFWSWQQESFGFAKLNTLYRLLWHS